MPIEIKQYPNDHKLLRFLSKDGLLRTLGIENNLRQITDMNPTFLLRSLEYYREQEDYRGDKHENRIVTNIKSNGKIITLCNTKVDPVLVSCWSCYQSDSLVYLTPWQTFPDTVAAIEATVEDIASICGKIAPAGEVTHYRNWGSLRTDFLHHGEIVYYQIDDPNINDSSIGPKICFYKRQEPHSKEKEYRFAMMIGPHPEFSPETFCVKLKQTNYINKIYLRKDCFSQDELEKIKIYYSAKLEII